MRDLGHYFVCVKDEGSKMWIKQTAWEVWQDFDARDGLIGNRE